MAKNDEWCEFCDDMIKEKIVTVQGKEFEVCRQCESLHVNT